MFPEAEPDSPAENSNAWPSGIVTCAVSGTDRSPVSVHPLKLQLRDWVAVASVAPSNSRVAVMLAAVGTSVQWANKCGVTVMRSVKVTGAPGASPVNQ